MNHRLTIHALIRLLIGLSCLFQVAETIAAPGELDTTFAGDGKYRAGFGLSTSRAQAVALQADGKLVVAGEGRVSSESEIAVVRYNADGSLDTSFGDEGRVFVPSEPGLDTLATAVKIQTDGKIVVAGYSYLSDINGSLLVDFVLIRFNADGSLDTSFDGDGKVTTSIGTNTEDAASALAIQDDGKIVAAGYTSSGAAFDFALARFNTDGSLDTSFDLDGKVITPVGASNDRCNAVAIQPDGKIVVAGSAFNGSTNDFALVRYNANGSLDTSFDFDGKIVTDVGGSDEANAIAIQPGTATEPSRIVAAGHSSFRFAIVCYSLNGSLDTSFDGDGKVITSIGTAEVVTAVTTVRATNFQPYKIIVAGGIGNGFALARYNFGGSLDTSFDGDGIVITSFGTPADGAAMTLQAGNKIVVAGYAGTSSNRNFAVARYNTNGSLDVSFDGDGIRTDEVDSSGPATARGVAIQPDGKIVITGPFVPSQSSRRFALMRFNSNGTLDTSFSGDGREITNLGSPATARAVAIQTDGKIVVAGYVTSLGETDFRIVRYTTDGSFDLSETTPVGMGADIASSMAIQPDGKIVVAGSVEISGFNYDFAVVRYNSDGSLDTSFSFDGKVITPVGASNDTCNAVAIQPDGKIVVAGLAFNESTYDFAVVRYNANGSLDNSFDGDGKMIIQSGNSSFINAVAIQQNGKIIVAGYVDSHFAVARFNADGSLDSSFDGDGLATTSIGEAHGAVIQPDGKILVVGYSYSGTTTGIDFTVVRYNPDGSLDGLYGSGGKAVIDTSNGGEDVAYGVALDSAGRAVVVGEANGMFGVVRISGDIPPGCDYSLAPASDYLSARGGSSGFNVNVSAGCAWTAQASDSWIILVSNPTGAGNGTVSLEVRENFTAARLGTITVADQIFTLVQEGTSQACGYSISPQFANYLVGGGSGSFSVTTSPGCGWQAVSNQSWIVITSTGAAIGNGTINYTVAANTTGATRTGAILVGGRSLNVKQKGGP